MSSQAVVQGSLSAVAKAGGVSIAEAFLDAEIVAVVDVSGSMGMRDSRGGHSRYEVACAELAKLQQANPGKVAVVAFSTQAQFCPAGVPLYQGGSTDLAGALEFVQVADGTVRFVVISDGEPNDEREALRVAAAFTSEISCIYIGPEADRTGADFLRRLAKSRHGRYATADRAQELASTVQNLMLKAG